MEFDKVYKYGVMVLIVLAVIGGVSSFHVGDLEVQLIDEDGNVLDEDGDVVAEAGDEEADEVIQSAAAYPTAGSLGEWSGAFSGFTLSATDRECSAKCAKACEKEGTTQCVCGGKTYGC